MNQSHLQLNSNGLSLKKRKFDSISPSTEGTVTLDFENGKRKICGNLHWKAHCSVLCIGYFKSSL